MIDPNTTINVALTAQEWNQVLVTLGDGPYRVVALLIAKIQQQCMLADQAALASVAQQQRPTDLAAHTTGDRHEQEPIPFIRRRDLPSELQEAAQVKLTEQGGMSTGLPDLSA